MRENSIKQQPSIKPIASFLKKAENMSRNIKRKHTKQHRSYKKHLTTNIKQYITIH